MVWKLFSIFVSKAVSFIIEGRKDVLRKVTHETHNARWLRKGDELCRGTVIGVPMSQELCDKVIDIYKKCKSKKGNTALMLALDMGLMDMVWGSIECAKQTNTNLYNGQKGDECVKEFLWHYNKKKQTAFDIAVTKGHVEVARILLKYANRWCLRSQWIRRREALLQLIDHDPKFDDFIFEMLKSLSSIPVHINSHGAYVAAREGRADILKFMISLLKSQNTDIESIVTRCVDKHNALHIAIQNHHLEVIFLLIKEIPQLACRINESEESPLYLAAERRYFGVVELMLKKCKEISYEGPNGRTALHAAAISDSAECVEHLLHKDRNLLNVKDDRGWTPLHHAVYHNSSLAATKLLDSDDSIGYHELISKDSIKTSPIHLAASLGHCETMKVLMDSCPGCSDFIDNEGRNILHVAVENMKIKAIEFIFRDESLTNLINQKDKKGNTPIHLLVASDLKKMNTNTTRKMGISDQNSRLAKTDYMFDINPINNIKLTPLDMISSYDQRQRLIKF